MFTRKCWNMKVPKKLSFHSFSKKILFFRHNFSNILTNKYNWNIWKFNVQKMSDFEKMLKYELSQVHNFPQFLEETFLFLTKFSLRFNKKKPLKIVPSNMSCFGKFQSRNCPIFHSFLREFSVVKTFATFQKYSFSEGKVNVSCDFWKFYNYFLSFCSFFEN